MIARDDSLPLFAECKVDDFLYRRVTALPEEQVQGPRQRILEIGQVVVKWYEPLDRD